MSNFHPGQRIRVRGEEWQVEHARKHEQINGKAVWEIEAKGLTNIVAGAKYIFVDDLDTIEVVDPADIEPEIATSGRAIRAKLYWEAHLRRLLPRNGAIYLGQHGACQPYDYQMQPAFKALNMHRPRILIGDAVGLGKTIECGVLLAELIRRGKGKRILCAVPKATLEQFQAEMWGRFSIPFHRLDSKGLEKLRQDLPSTMNPFFHHDKAIISIDTLKLKKYQTWLESCDWDVLVIDECHNVADRTDGGGGSARHRVARRLAEKANAVILMSATPHDGTKHGFASLIKLLDRTRIKDDSSFASEDFIQHFIRRTRSQVADQIENRAPRKQLICKIPMTGDEIDVLRAIHDGDKLTTMLSKRHGGGQRELFKTTLIKSFLSSPYALLETVQKKLKSLGADPDRRIKTKHSNEEDREQFINFLEDLEHSIQSLGEFTRFKYLKEYLTKHPTKDDDRIVIFTERLRTMREIEKFLLKEKLVDGVFDASSDGKQPAGRLIATADGSLSDIELPRIVKAFQAKTKGIHILVATNVASEGLNLHTCCHRLIHFDLPWSLITLEQRNGRIDRLGQESTPEIFYFASTAEGSTKHFATKESFKDDFWIIDKIKKRVETASTDMAEEAMAKFVEGEEEEVQNTSAYEEGRIDQVDDVDPLLAMLANPDFAAAAAKTDGVNRRRLPTLFEKSPSDFILKLAKEAKLDVVEADNTAVTVKMDNALRFETAQWPREYQPDNDSNGVTLDADSKRVQSFYRHARASNAEVDRSFMNEIHPLIALLENTAIGFFPGRKVPTVTLKGDDKNAVYMLVQSTLYNKRNDAVDQFWQILYHKKGSPDLKPLFNMNEYDHAVKITAWLNDHLSQIVQKSDLTANERRRIADLTRRAVDTMKGLTMECRTNRSNKLRGALTEEINRIKAWESARASYLERLVNEGKDLQAQGVFSIQGRMVKSELESIHKDSDAYRNFIDSYLATSSEPDIRILGCLVVEE
ncbi:MAG: hypothetical protein RIQ81_151 [Pseudomonadota bacterium]